MSFLLEALKKSEEQKHRGEIPTIHSATPQGPERGKSHLPLVAIVVLLLIVIAWLSWRTWFTGEQAASVETPAGPEVAVTASAPPLSPMPSQQPPRQISEAATGQLAERPAELIQRPQTAVPGDASRTPVEKFEGETASWTATPQVNNSANPKTDENGSNSNTQALLPAEDEVARLSQQAASLGEPGTDGEGDRPLPETAGTQQPHRSEPVSIWELPDSVRQGLPAMRMSVLVYAERVDDRFALINGERLQQGDELVAGLEVEEIRRDGVVFSYQFYRFLLRR